MYSVSTLADAIETVSSVGGVLPHTYSWDIGQIGNFVPTY